MAHLADVTSFLVRQPEGARRGPVYAGLAVALFQIVVAGVGAGIIPEVVYLGSLVWHLAGAGMGFVFLIWGGRARSDVMAEPTEVDQI